MIPTPISDTNTLDPELEVLQSIYSQSDHVRQRDLARVIGLSLGMTNSIVKRLVQKGWLTIKKVNNRNILYAVSAEGMDQIARRSYRYFRRTVKNIVNYREAIEQFIDDLKKQGYLGIILVGQSDLDFIVEHTCLVRHIEYVKDDKKAERARQGEPHLFTLYSERYIPDEEEKRTRPSAAFLQEVVSGPNGGFS